MSVAATTGAGPEFWPPACAVAASSSAHPTAHVVNAADRAWEGILKRTAAPLMKSLRSLAEGISRIKVLVMHPA